MKIIQLTLLAVLFSIGLKGQDFQWLAQQETTFMEVSGNGDIYLVSQLPSITDVDPGAGEWILNVPSGTYYLSKYDASGDFEWTYAFEDAIVTSLAASDSKVILTMNGGEQTILHANNNNYSSAEKRRYAAIYNDVGDRTQLIHLDSRDATIVSAHLDTDGSIFLTGTIKEEADFDTHIIDEHLYQSFGDQSGYYAKYTDETYPDWVRVFEDYSAGLISPAGLVGNDSSNLIWGFYTGNVDMDFSQSVELLYDTIPNTTQFFLANYDQSGGLNWSRSYSTNQPSFNSILVDDVTFSSEEDIYITGRYKGTVYDSTLSTAFTGGTEFNNTFLLGIEQWGTELFRYQLSNELESSRPSIVMNPEDEGLWWIGSISGTMDLDPTVAGTYNVTTNINPLSGSAQTHINAVYYTELSLDGDVVKINYLNSPRGLLYDMVRTNENRSFYMFAGGSNNKLFDHDFGLDTYYDSTLTRSYISLYDAFRIPEALGQKEEIDNEYFRVWPNPTQGLIRFSQATDHVRVYDLSGRQIQIISTSTEVNLAQAAAGLYIVEVELNGSVEVFKIQKL
ncbi:T9SS type A sorting domain-containing protein [Salibacteraceae bacterium]|nr:T9SS type A sorting domain-containing protein [Salibacteraceae bacterium]